jgi:DNA polymerase-3 subunit alpha
MAALISSVMNTKDKVPYYVAACEELGIEVLPPDVNESACDFAVVHGKIRFGLNAVKNVGDSAARAIVRAREEGGPFTSIFDFTERVDPQVANKRALESLVKCGALDSTGGSRRGMLEVLESALAWGVRHSADRIAGQGSIFDLGGPPAGDGGPSAEITAITAPADPPVPDGEFEQRELLAMEKETLGTYVTSHPLSGVREALRERVDCSLAELRNREDRSMLTIGGLIGERKKLRTRSGADMMFASLDDLEGTVELLAFNQVLETCGEILQPDRVVVVKGRLDHREGGRTSFVVQEAEAFEPDGATVAAARSRANAPAQPFTLSLSPADFEATLIEELKGIFSAYPGECEVLLEMPTNGGVRRLRFGRDYRVSPSAALRADVDSLLSSRAIAA